MYVYYTFASTVHVHVLTHVNISPGIEPGSIIFPSQNNNVQFLLGVLLPCETLGEVKGVILCHRVQ
jgi:hypothetical protein